MRRLAASVALCAVVATGAAAQTTLPAEPEPGPFAACFAGSGGIAAALSASNPGLAVLFATFCVILVEDIRKN